MGHEIFGGKATRLELIRLPEKSCQQRGGKGPGLLCAQGDVSPEEPALAGGEFGSGRPRLRVGSPPPCRKGEAPASTASPSAWRSASAGKAPHRPAASSRSQPYPALGRGSGGSAPAPLARAAPASSPAGRRVPRFPARLAEGGAGRGLGLALIAGGGGSGEASCRRAAFRRRGPFSLKWVPSAPAWWRERPGPCCCSVGTRCCGSQRRCWRPHVPLLFPSARRREGRTDGRRTAALWAPLLALPGLRGVRVGSRRGEHRGVSRRSRPTPIPPETWVRCGPCLGKGLQR